MTLVSIVDKAKHSGFWLWMLNIFFERMVPFNIAHRFRITHVADGLVKTRLPYRRKNLNHVKGLHACALATLTELTSGFLLATTLDPTKYRIILRKLEMDYLYQGKMDAVCEFSVSPEWLQQHVFGPLTTADSTDLVAEVKIFDVQGNQLTLGRAHWQVKEWSKVRTKIKN